MCKVKEGSFYVLPPSGWDGHSALRTNLHFHGWGNTARSMMRKDDLVKRFSEEGWLLVLPDAEGGAWSVMNTEDGRDDLAFIDAVLDYVVEEWHADPAELYASGHSLGGSMVWNLACHTPGRFEAFAPTSGGFWAPIPARCEGGSVDLRHSHGLNDTTVPLEGRSFGGMAQADIYAGWEVLKEQGACDEQPVRSWVDGPLDCEAWSCEGGRELRLCLHDGQHAAPDGWVGRALAWYDDPERR